MKTPTAILLGLALIAAAIFLREPSIKSAQAVTPPAYQFQCNQDGCYFLAGTNIYFIKAPSDTIGLRSWNWNN